MGIKYTSLVGYFVVMVFVATNRGVGFSRGAYQVRVLAEMIHEVRLELDMERSVELKTHVRSA